MPANDPHIFPEACTVLDALIQGLDATAPGLITSMHMIGSIALGDGRSGQSDIDLVLVRTDSADNATTMPTLESVLADLRKAHPRPVLDGLVLSVADLEAGPDQIDGDRPIIFDSTLRIGPDGSGRNPVTWQTLRQCGITYRGNPIDAKQLWHNPERLDSWTRENLESYWRPWLSRVASIPDGQLSHEELQFAVAWGVLGVTRLHYTLATGRVTSKYGAGLYALETFSSCWHPIIKEALRIRERHSEGQPIPLRRFRDLQSFVEMAIDDALAMR